MVSQTQESYTISIYIQPWSASDPRREPTRHGRYSARTTCTRVFINDVWNSCNWRFVRTDLFYLGHQQCFEWLSGTIFWTHNWTTQVNTMTRWSWGANSVLGTWQANPAKLDFSLENSAELLLKAYSALRVHAFSSSEATLNASQLHSTFYKLLQITEYRVRQSRLRLRYISHIIYLLLIFYSIRYSIATIKEGVQNRISKINFPCGPDF